MNAEERAGIICSLLNFKAYSRQDADNFDAVIKEIKQAEQAAFEKGRKEGLKQELEKSMNIAKEMSEDGYKEGFEEGQREMREKAAGIAENYVAPRGRIMSIEDCQAIAKRIGEMEP